MRVAMIYQHNAKGRDQQIAEALDKLIDEARKEQAQEPGAGEQEDEED